MLDPDFVTILRGYLRYLPPTEELAADVPLRSLGLDSMALVALMMDLEDRFGVTLPDRLLNRETFADAGSLWSALESLGAAV